MTDQCDVLRDGVPIETTTKEWHKRMAEERDGATIAKPVIDDLRQQGWVVLTKAEYEELRESRESWRVLCCDTVAKNIEQQAQLAAMREALKVSLEHWEMYDEFFVDAEREAFAKSCAVLRSSVPGGATEKPTFERRIDDLGRVVIPKVVRQELGIKEGDLLGMRIVGGQVIIERLEETSDGKR